MKLAAATFLAMASTAAAFSPYAGKSAGAAKTVSSSADPMNGWVPDSNKFAYGLPGSLDPVPDFDPLGFAADADLDKIKQYREAELQHGRVAMLATVGFLATEKPFEWHPLFNQQFSHIGPAIYHLQEVRAVAPAFFELLGIFIAGFELNRALTGWTEPGDVFATNRIFKPNYYPGDVGFDPLRLKPTDAEGFADMQTKELQHGRLAMLAAAGFMAQELVNNQEILVNLGVGSA